MLSRKTFKMQVLEDFKNPLVEVVEKFHIVKCNMLVIQRPYSLLLWLMKNNEIHLVRVSLCKKPSIDGLTRTVTAYTLPLGRVHLPIVFKEFILKLVFYLLEMS